MPGGGARGAYQAGVLSRLGKLVPDFDPSIITGVSVGAINGAFIANHMGSFGQASAALAKLWAGLETERVIVTGGLPLARNILRWARQLTAAGASSTSGARALLDTSPLRSLLNQQLGQGVDQMMGLRRKLAAGRLEALAVTVTSYRTGKALTFSQSRDPSAGANWNRPYREGREPQLTVDHVLASCALPLLFPAVQVDDEWCGDGSVRESAPLSPAMHLGADRLLVISTSGPPPTGQNEAPDTYPSTARVMGVVANALMFDSAEFDASYATRLTRLLREGPRSQSGLRPVDVMLLKPSADLGRLAAKYEQHLPSVVRHMTRPQSS